MADQTICHTKRQAFLEKAVLFRLCDEARADCFAAEPVAGDSAELVAGQAQYSVAPQWFDMTVTG